MDWLERVKEERDELRNKREKLLDFCTSDKFSELPQEHQQLLLAQASVIFSYIHILNARITLAEK